MKKHSTKRALIASILSLTLCFSSLIGTTFAWFTDTVTSANNVIAAGNLDVELYHVNDKVTTASPVAGDTELFDSVDLWEPGAMAWEKFTIKNAGSLALKYQFTLNALEATVVDGISFASVLKVAIVDESFSYTRENVEALSDWTSLKSFTLDGELVNKGDTKTFGIIIWWQPSEIDNVFNMNNGKTGDVSVKVGVVLAATQMASEEDGFGTDYDYDAPIVSAPIDRPDAPVTLKGAQNVMIELTQEAVEKLPADVESISIAISEPKIDATANTITFATIELVDQDGEVIDLESLNLTGKITVTLPAQTVFAKDTPVMIYHDGEYVANAVVGENGVISYDVAHLCEVTVGAVEEPSVDEETGNIEIGSVSQLFAFAQSVNAGKTYAGETVVLTADIDLNNVAWTPIGNFTYDINTNGDGYVYGKTFKGTFDGQGHTIKNLYVNDPNTSGVGLFGYVTDATVKKLTIENVKLNALSHVAAFVARANGTSTVTNCNLTGDIDINAYWAYVGGIVGKAYAIEIDNCTVTPNGIGKITSENRNAVGSILAWMESASTVTNCKAQDLNLTGWANIGGITGFVNKNGTVANCSARNITLTKTRVDGIGTVGLAAGGWCGAGITIQDNTFDTITLNGTMVPNNSVDVLFGGEFYGKGNASDVTVSNNTTENITNHLTEVEGIADGVVKNDEGVYVVFNANGLKVALTKAAEAGAGDNTIQLACDIDLTGTQWTPVSVDGYNGAGIVTVLGNGATIKGLSAPLFAGGFAGKSGIVIKDLTIADSTVESTSNQGGGAFIDTADSMHVLTLENCHLVNSTVSGERAGGLIGWCSGYAKLDDGPVKANVTIKNCSVVDSVIHANGSAGAIAGHPGASDYTYTTIEDCKVENVKVISDEPVSSWRTGAIVGTANNGHVVIKNVTVEDVTLTQDGVTATETKLYGRFVPSGTGTLEIDGVPVVATAGDLAAAIAENIPEILLAAGTYEVDLYNIAARDTLIIKGQGADTKLKFKNLQVRASQFNTLTIDNCTIERMPDKAWGHLVFGSSAAAGGVYTVSNCIFNGVGSQGIYVNQTVEATFNVKDCVFNGDFGGEGAITVQNNDGVNITLNVTDCEFNSIPETSHEIYVLYAYAEWTLKAEGVDVFWKTAQP